MWCLPLWIGWIHCGSDTYVATNGVYVLPLTAPSMLNSYSFLAYFCQNYTFTIIGIILFVMILQIRHDGDGTVSPGNPLLGIAFNGEAAFRVVIRLVIIIRLSREKLFKHRHKTYGNGNRVKTIDRRRLTG